jgi:predicted O-methyltransferase YrrM
MDRGDRIGLIIERAIRDGVLVARVDGSTHEPFPVAISGAEGEALRSWVAGERARTTIEVGLGYAISTLFICDGLLSSGATDVGHVAIDPNQRTRFANVGLQLLDEAGVADVVEFHESRSEIVLPRFLEERRSFDLAFVDGNHRFDGAFLDLTYLGRLVKPGGVVFVDDNQLPAIERAVSFFVRNVGWEVLEVSDADPLHGWVVLRTSDGPDERDFDHFVDF